MSTRCGLVCILAIAPLVGCPAAPLAGDWAVILQYHHFGDDTPPVTSVTREQFDAHLAYLAEHDFAVWPLADLVAAVADSQSLPERCVAITVDDAYVSVYTEAYPRLAARGWPCTVFVTSGGVDAGVPSYMTWEQMRRLGAQGFEFANHSRTHDYLIRRRAGESEASWRRRVTRDIEDCQARLTAELGHAPALFAYPYGEYDPALQEIVRGLGLVGLGQHSGGIWPGSDFTVLPRFPMAGSFAAMENFITKVRSRPLPVLRATPANPVLPPGVDRPVLRLTLAPGPYRMDQLAAYASGQGAIELRWVDRAARVVEIVAREPLPPGRSRYNCTAPHRDGTPYFWFSRLWIR